MSESIGEKEILNRFGYHAGNEQTRQQHEDFRDTVILFAKYLDKLLPHGQAKSTAFSHLQEMSMWSNFAIAEQAPVVYPTPLPDKNSRMITEVSSARRAVPR